MEAVEVVVEVEEEYPIKMMMGAAVVAWQETHVLPKTGSL